MSLSYSEITEQLDFFILLTTSSVPRHPEMGGTQSTSTAADSIDTKLTENKNANYGLFNVSGESLSNGAGINFLEVTTFVVVFLGAMVYIKYTCAKRRKKKLAEMSAHLQMEGINVPVSVPRVAPSVARVPVMGPPIYQPSPVNHIDKYDI